MRGLFLIGLLCLLSGFYQLLFLYLGRRSGLRPTAQSPSFAPPKERNPRKGGPAGRVPALRSGQLAMLSRGAVQPNSLRSLRSLRSSSGCKLDHEARASFSALARPSPCASQRGQRGGEPDSDHCYARPCTVSRKRLVLLPLPQAGEGGGEG